MHPTIPCRPVFAVALALFAPALLPAQTVRAPGARANWELAEKFNAETMRRVTYSTTVQARFIGRSDSLWYNWRDRTGNTFYLVYPPTRVKRPLFDHVKLAAALATAHRRPYDPNRLPFATVSFTRDHRNIRFTVDSTRYEWSLAGETIRNIGRPPRGDSIPPDEEREERQQGGGGGGGGGPFGPPQGDFRNWSPDSTAFVFARDHNLYLVEKGRSDTVKISTDGEKNRSFGFRDTTQVQQDDSTQGQGGRNRDPRVRANVVWSPDSRAFAVQRQDQRKVKELYLVNVLAEPRPTLSSYTYAMPGEENVAQTELYAFRRGESSVRPVNVRKWKDQRLLNVHFATGSQALRVVRRDRPQRALELIEVDLASNAIKVLITESVENANLEWQPPRYAKAGGDIVWWSERSGWGHYYLYDHNGAYRRPLTAGAWRADQIPQIDSTAGVIYVSGVGREPGENVYQRHLYKVNADGSGFSRLDEGDGDHSFTISPSKKFVVDSWSRPDLPPTSVLRDVTGRVVMPLEQMDLSQLTSMGWKPPTTFVVKAADGVTDIYGNMWKPFDFDSTKKYPIIASVYPGPQTEQVNVAFNPGGTQQQLAQLGFIVIQIGNRGGNPLRSNAYQNFSYFNLRDYALADKKAGIEQLAARHAFIDIEKVGIYGHSGGGFLTGAALMLPPYNEFFKVGVSSSGNHDNNIYNQNWSEQYHGLKAVVAGSGAARGRRAASGSGVGGAPVTLDTTIVDDSVRYEIKVPTNIELAPNLKGRILLATGDMDNNVHPGGTIRLVNALIKANKRFDFMLLPGKPHGYGDYQPYFNRAMMEYFAEHLLGDYYRSGAEIR
ncbi:MAG: DPP IV N-terminal domain-containing protein [Gemmatimonadaceae bacterium]|nr:DPP IV N-terminal domain-containing protein [Gemmatimonadaceae bacterium]